jgi:hypothetical protein
VVSANARRHYVSECVDGVHADAINVDGLTERVDSLHDEVGGLPACVEEPKRHRLNSGQTD